MTIAHRLPPKVLELARRLGVPEQSAARVVRLSQKGRIRKDENAGWMDLTAKQSIDLTRCSFEWKARIKPLGIVTVRDALTETEGLLQVRAFGFLPVASSSGDPELTRGERIRYLAEIPWAVDAILLNHSLRWSERASGELCLADGEGRVVAEVTLKLDGDGRIIEACCPDRPRSVGKQFIGTPWRGFFSDYRPVAGRQIPFRGGASWMIDGREQVYGEFELTGWSVY
jgi:hypothetical protein